MKKFLKKNFLFCLILTSVFFISLSVFSYHNQITHPALTEQAVFLYNKTASEKISNFEIGFVSVNNQSAQSEIMTDETVKVKYVIDGDTIVLEDGRKARYVGMDAPELNKDGAKDDECLAWAARERNRILLKNAQEIVLVKDNGADTDKYGRLLRYVYADNIFVNSVLAREGLAKFFICEQYMENCPVMKDSERIAIIKQAGTEAENARRGIYSNVCETEKLKNIGSEESVRYKEFSNS